MTSRVSITTLEKMVYLWGEGCDTLDIARWLCLHESEVYNNLTFVRQIRRGIAQSKGAQHDLAS